MKLDKNTLIKLIKEQMSKMKELDEEREVLEEEPIEHLEDPNTGKQKEEDHSEAGYTGTAPLNEEEEKLNEEKEELEEEKDGRVIEKGYKGKEYKGVPGMKKYLKEVIEETITDMIKNEKFDLGKCIKDLDGKKGIDNPAAVCRSGEIATTGKAQPTRGHQK